MADQELYDYRRTDLRNYKTDHPFWVTSREVDEADAEDLAAVLFSFPGEQDYMVQAMIVEVTEAAVGGTPTLTVGLGTLLTDDVTTAGDMTIVDIDEYFTSAVSLPAALGKKLIGASDFATAFAVAGGQLITGADAAVPCIAAFIASDTTLTAGKFKVHVLLSKVPV